MGNKKITIALCLACLAALLLVQSAWAVPPQPMLVYGTVLWNGANVPVGTKVSAWCGSLKVGSATAALDEGVTHYAIPVVGDDTSTSPAKEGCAASETVTFKLDTDQDTTWDFDAIQTTTWSQGGILELDLTTNPQPAVTLVKRTNGQDVAAPPGPYILVGQAVSWSYLVTNSGNVKLSGIQVSDDQGISVSCPKTSLNASEGMTCTASGAAAAGQYTNTGSVTALPPGGLPAVNASDQSWYFGAAPAISIKKYTNSQDADSPTGPYIPAGNALSWTYATTNTGNVPLSNVSVSDSKGVFVSCPKTTLAVSESMTCSAQGSAVPGQYTNTGTASGKYAAATVTASDLSYYFGATLGLTIEARTNGQDADSAPGPLIVVGQPVSWSYLVTNTSNVPLTGVVVSDSRSVTVTCPKPSLSAGEAMTCTASGTAAAGQYSNTGSTSGIPPGGLATQMASDLSHYFGADPKLSIETRANNQEADTAPGAYILVGQPVSLGYTVTNVGNVTLTGIAVSDSQGTTVSCPKTSLAVLESMVCSASTAAAAGQQNHTGTASTSFNGFAVDASDPAYYYGAQTSLAIETRTNGQEADNPPGVEILAGQAVTWTYAVTNTSNVPLSTLVVTDDRGVTVSCPQATLVVSEQITCSASGTAAAGQYSNVGTARAAPPGGLPQVSASDPSNYFGVNPKLSIETRTNGLDADTPTGPYIPAGNPVSWSYLVGNTGNVALSSVLVIDDHGVTITCPKTTLAVSEQMTCTASGIALAGQYSNTGTASTTYLGTPVSASDPSHYFGAAPAITLEKRTNGLAAASTPGPALMAGTTVTWTYKVTNSGNVPLSNVNVIDDQGEAVSCPGSSLEAGASLTCSAGGTVESGPYSNKGTASGTPPGELAAVSVHHTNFYFGAAPSLALGVRINGQPAQAVPGPYTLSGSTVTWTYTVTNTGNTALSGLQVVDTGGMSVTCPLTDLPVGASRTCSAQDNAGMDQFSSSATASALFSGALENKSVSASRTSYYFGASPVITLEKRTNGQHYTAAPGAYILAGNPVTWTYLVSNGGNVPLSGITVTDDRGVTVNCPKTSLAVSEGMTCSANGTATPGQYANTGTVTATPPGGLASIQDQDASYYFGAIPSINLETATNGQDGDQAPGPYIPINNVVNWTYAVTNTGNVALTTVSVSDDQGVTIDCPQNNLAVDEYMTCTANGTASAGQYSNLGSVSADPPGGLAPVGAADPSHYFGAQPDVVIDTLINGQESSQEQSLYILAGQAVNWTYVITNTGNVALSAVTVTNNRNLPVSCPKNTLAVGEKMTCSANGTAVMGHHYHTGGVSAIPPGELPQIGSSDLSHYFGASPTLSIETLTNGDPADDPPGEYIKEGVTVAWTYVVTNTGNVPLTSVLVIDSQGVTVTCPGSLLEPSISMTCSSSGLAIVGQYSNLGTVTGTPPEGLSLVSTSDPSHYIGYTQDPSLDIRKYTNGVDADSPPGVYLPVGTPIAWTYVINNTGGVPFTNVFVMDDMGTPDPLDDAKVCDILSLDSLTSHSCLMNGTAAPGQYGNTATAKGTFIAQLYQATDTSHYFGAITGIQLELYANGLLADSATGPYLLAGTSVSWTYAITNTSNVALNGVAVTDSKGTTISCPGTTLGPAVHMLCTASSTAITGQFSKTATVLGTPPGGLANISTTDPAYYFGAAPSLDLIASTNGQDADTEPGPFIPVGDAVQWSYLVTNTGNVDLTGIAVTDDQGVTVTCLQTTLAPAGTTTCSASGIAAEGQYSNLGTVIADPPGELNPVSASDPSHYFGARPDISLVALTNGQDANTAPGTYILTGLPVSWTYLVQNTGNVSLSGLLVTDSQGVTVTCSKTTLAPAEQITCSANGIAAAGPYSNIGTVTANPPGGLSPVSDTDPSHYFGAQPSISLTAATNNQDADSTPGPYILVGQQVIWTYTINNTGNVALSSVTLSDNRLGLVSCPKTTLAATEQMTCTANGTAAAGQYSNLASVTGTPPGGLASTPASDPSHYFGANPLLTLEMRTNGTTTPNAPGPYLLVGSQVNWSYVLRNTGNVTLSSLQVSDSAGVNATCAKTSLAPGENHTCTASGTAVAGQYVTQATASGTPPGGLAAVHPASPGYYYGAQPGIRLKAYTNGQDANMVVGPYILVGEAVTWTYIITNTGNVNLGGVLVTDDQGVTVTCPQPTLAINEHITCSANGVSSAGQYANLASVTATPPGGLSPIGSSDPSHYFGADPAIQLNKLVNNQDSNDPPGPYLLVGSPINWTFLVSNTGNVPLEDITVMDELELTIYCPQNTLAAGSSMTCTASANASPGVAYESGMARGSIAGKTVSDTDPAYYFGAEPVLRLELRTNDQDASSAPGAYVPAGGAVQWTYTITNLGNVNLSGVTLSASGGVSPDCPADTDLEPDEQLVCTAEGTALAGQHAATAEAQATPDGGLNAISASDSSHYFGYVTGLQLGSRLNGLPTQPPGPYVLTSSELLWEHQVTNTSNVTLNDIVLKDGSGAAIACPKGTLEAGEAMLCTPVGTAVEGAQSAQARASGTFLGQAVNSSLVTAYYFGASPGLELVLLLDGAPNNDLPGPSLLVGSTISWSYVITNTGNVVLSQLGVIDSQGSSASCPKTTLAPGEWTTCTAQNGALADRQTNTAAINALAPVGPPVTATDQAHYFGLNPQMTLEVLVNGLPAASEPGPSIRAGETVTLTMTVHNSGNVPLEGIALADDLLGEVACPQTSLAAGQEMVCIVSEISVLGQHTHTASVQASFGEILVGNESTSYYLGIPAIQYVYLPMIRR